MSSESCWSLCLAFFCALLSAVPRSIDRIALIGLFQLLWDRSECAMRSGAESAPQRLLFGSNSRCFSAAVEPSVWTTYMNGGLDSTTPAHRSLFHYGLGDAQVRRKPLRVLTCLLSHSSTTPHLDLPPSRRCPGSPRRTSPAPWARRSSRGRQASLFFAVPVASPIPTPLLLQPLEGNQSLADFSFVPADTVLSEGSVVVGFDYGFPTVPFTNQAPNDGFDAHECPRRTPAAQAQMFHFFETGERCRRRPVHCEGDAPPPLLAGDIVNYCGSGGCHANSSVC